MSSRKIPDHVRNAAVEDYKTSGDNIAKVAARHNVPRSTLGHWVKHYRPADELAYCGTTGFDHRAWEMRGGILHPLFPERRTA